MPSGPPRLPETIGGWKLEAPPRRIDPVHIFEYMNGAGELYLSYRFNHLLVYEYKHEEENDLLVEIYDMKDARDAFGLLSLDWGGEDVALGRAGGARPASSIAPPSRALYGEGLLRAWSGNWYIRISAFKETPRVRDVILELGRTLAAGRDDPPPPELLEAVKPSADSAWTVRKDRTAYFRSHLVLNSFFYLSHENILSLSPSGEAVAVVFEKPSNDKPKPSCLLLLIRYADAEQASAALTGFVRAYLPDREGTGLSQESGDLPTFFLVEDGWLGYRPAGRHLALVFGCPGPEAAREILGRVVLPKT